MALVRDRRQLNLRLPLTELSNRRPRFPLPLPLLPSSSSSSAAAAAAASSTAGSGATGISLSDLESLGVLGHGNGGTVYRVRHRRTSAVYALKVVQAGCDGTVRRQLLREREILLRTDSPHVVRCHGIFEKPNGDVAILMEHMDAGSLQTLLEASGTFSEKHLAAVARHVLNGLNYLHSHKIIHRDIKPSNLLVNSGKQVKIADFGVSRILSQTMDPCNSSVGTIAYMSPERINTDLNHGKYTGYAGDIWSFGVSILEFYLGRFPFAVGRQGDWASLMCAICMSEPPEAPASASHDFRDFIGRCLQRDPARRWAAYQLLRHPFILTHNQRLHHQVLPPPPPPFSSS